MQLTRTHKRVFEDILEHFKELTKKREIKPGDRLQPERELAAGLGVSRASVREAFRALEMLGFLSINPGKGTYVLPPDAHSLSEFTELTMYLRPTIFENILEARVIIECAAARLAAKRASQEELANIKTALERMMLVSEDAEMSKILSETDFDFHKGMILATHNDFLVFLYDIIGVLLKKNTEKRIIETLAVVPNALDVIKNSHQGIFEAVKKGDEFLAEKKLREHFDVLS